MCEQEISSRLPLKILAISYPVAIRIYKYFSLPSLAISYSVGSHFATNTPKKNDLEGNLRTCNSFQLDATLICHRYVMTESKLPEPAAAKQGRAEVKRSVTEASGVRIPPRPPKNSADIAEERKLNYGGRGCGGS